MRQTRRSQGARAYRWTAVRRERGRAEWARARKAEGESVSAIAKALDVSRATLYRHLGDDS
ncbi:helix-turn-helix domain-containing protein [Streptomyces sp. NPDC001312]|uniref:helix-turn-helix domain-containing protein n=1 Tax=Streptomyces sp. NPDC001312 TaxID=3364561 RepID=UPI00367732AE